MDFDFVKMFYIFMTLTFLKTIPKSEKQNLK